MSLPGDSTAAPHWLPYVGVADVAATVAQAKSLGATVQKDTTVIPNMGKYAVLADPQGAAFAVYTSTDEPHDPASGVGGFSWHELSTTDAEAALAFYTKLFGWELGPKHDMGPMVYHLFLHNGAQYGGAFVSTSGDAPSWLCYVSVEDIDKAAASAKSAGGRLLNGPMEVPGGSWVAQVMDPAGAAFAVHEEMSAATTQPAPAAKPAAEAKPKAPKPEPKAAAATPPPAAKPTASAKPPAVSKPSTPAPKPVVASAPAAAKPAAAPPAAKSAPAKPAVKAKKKAPPKPKAAAKKAAKKVAKKAAKKAPAKAKSRKASKKGVAKKAAGKKKSAAKRAPAKKKSSARKSSPPRAKAKKHR
jgi:predicted enzyme related to lactoylglutathione lyase